VRKGSTVRALWLSAIEAWFIFIFFLVVHGCS